MTNRSISNLHIQPDQPQHMLQQLRKLLTSNTFLSTDQIQNIPDDKINVYLKQSYRMVQDDKLSKSKDPYLMYSKISQASQLLKQQTSMIKNYVKGKIQANLHSARDIKTTTNGENYQKLLEIRQQLQKKRLQQKIEQNKKINKMIESTRKFKKYQNKQQIPLPILQSLIKRQRSDADKIIKQDYKLKSSNNKLIAKQKLEFNVDTSMKKNKKGKIQKQKVGDIQNYMIQVHGVEEDQSFFTKSKTQGEQNKIQQILKRNKKFIKVFTAFLSQQLKTIESNSAVLLQQIQNKSLQNTEKAKRRFKFNKLQQKFSNQTPPEVKISQLSKIFKFRSFIPHKQQQYQAIIKIQPIKKIVSKRIGNTNKYHMKQCLLENRVLYYGDQKVKKSDMKGTQIAIAPLDTIEATKQEGGIFQKKQQSVQVVILKGKSKDLVFQLKLAQGIQLREQIIKVNLRRLHRMTGLIGGQNNKNMQIFIEEEHTVLDLSESYIRNQEEYPLKSFRLAFINIIISLFPNRKATTKLNFTRCRLSINQINLIIRQSDKYFQNITQLNFSHTKLDKQNLKNILNLAKKCPASSKISLNLTNCGLDDSVIQANIQNFSENCPKIQTLQLAQNQITSKSIVNLRNIFSTKICEIKTLNLSKCPIQQFGQIVNLIKTANNLQNVIINECNKLSLNNHKQFQDLLISTQNKQQLKSISLAKNIFTGTIKWFQEISPYLELSIELPNKSKNSLQSKYLKVTLNQK